LKLSVKNEGSYVVDIFLSLNAFTQVEHLLHGQLQLA